MADKNELKALTLKDEINANHRECLRAGNETIQYAIQTGALLSKVKALVPHGEFQKWVGQFCDFSYDVAAGYMRLQKELGTFSKVERAQLLTDATSVTNLKKLLKPKENATSSPKTPPPSGKQHDVQIAHQEPAPAIVEPDEPDTLDTPEPPEAPCCPNCGASDYDADEDGLYCRSCKEPAQEQMSRQAVTQRQKTIKTVEALMRAFDDLQDLRPGSRHQESIDGCKSLLKIARDWK